MLEVHEAAKLFGGVIALKNISLNVAENELLGIIGPNGSGKTTLINVVNGVFKPDRGTISFRNRRIDGLAPYQIAQRGIGRTFQVTKVFRRMSVLENLMVPGLAAHKPENRRHMLKKALETLDLLKLLHLKDEYARNLSGGQHKLLELGRVLMLNPDLILLDEPFAGIHPELKEELHAHIRTLHAQGKTIVLISHDMHSIFKLSQRIVVLSNGEKIADGSREEIRNNELVIEAYLGR